MKTGAMVVLTASLVLAGAGAYAEPSAGCDLSGEWEVVISLRGMGSGEVTVEKDVVSISQSGNDFFGTRTLGGKRIGKNEEWIRGRVANGMVEEVSILVTDDPVVFSTKWNGGRAAIAAGGNMILAQTFNGSDNYLTFATLTKK